MILITSTGEFLLYFIVSFSFVSFQKKKKLLQDYFWVALFFAAGIHFQWFKNSKGRLIKVNFPTESVLSLNCDQMEHLEGKQYSQYHVERNPIAYMSMRDYGNIPWHNQRPVKRNPNLNRSMRDYRDQWMSAHLCSVPSTYAPPASPHFTLTPQPSQPPQLISPVEQAILNLSKLVDNFIEGQRVVNVQANQEIDTMESSLNKELDRLQSELDHKFDNLEGSISKLASQQHAHQEGENPEGECLTDTMVEEQCQQQGLSESSYICVVVCPWEKKEEILPLLSKEDSGEGAVEEH